MNVARARLGVPTHEQHLYEFLLSVKHTSNGIVEFTYNFRPERNWERWTGRATDVSPIGEPRTRARDLRQLPISSDERGDIRRGSKSDICRISRVSAEARPAGFEPATVGLEVQPKSVQQGESSLREPITSKEIG